MYYLKRHPAWNWTLVLLLVLSNLPRLGCVCADGTHLACCQKVIRGMTDQFCRLFHSSDADKSCPCCAAKQQKQKTAEAGCNGSEDPCQCQVTLEGPQWASSQRVEIPIDFAISAVLLAPMSLFDSSVRIEPIRSVDSGPPTPLLASVLQLNV